LFVIPQRSEGICFVFFAVCVAVVSLYPNKENVISTEAAHALVSSRAEKSASLPTPFASHPARLPLPVLPGIQIPALDENRVSHNPQPQAGLG
jgi:hypothetical protein